MDRNKVARLQHERMVNVEQRLAFTEQRLALAERQLAGVVSWINGLRTDDAEEPAEDEQ